MVERHHGGEEAIPCRASSTERAVRRGRHVRTELTPLPQPHTFHRTGAADRPGQVVLAPPVPVVEEPLHQRVRQAGAPGLAGSQPDHRVGALPGRPQRRTELGERGQPAGQPRRVHPAGVRCVGGDTVPAPATRPLVGQHHLRPLGTRRPWCPGTPLVAFPAGRGRTAGCTCLRRRASRCWRRPIGARGD